MVISNQSNSKIEDIDLNDIILSVWKGKWLVLIITLISLIYPIYIFGSNNVNVEKSIQLSPIGKIELDKYEHFNEFKYKKKQEESDASSDSLESFVSRAIERDKEVDFYLITKQYLLDIFGNILNTREDLIEIIKNSELISREAYSNQADFEKAAEALSYDNFIIQSLFNQTSDQIDGYVFKYSGNILDEKIMDRILFKTITTVNNKVRIYIIEQFNKKIQNLKNHNKRLILNFNFDINEIVKEFDLATKNRVAFLEGQAKIARALKIQDNIINTELSKAYFSSEVDIIKEKLPFVMPGQPFSLYFLRGYRAIEVEISLLTNRHYKDRHYKEPYILKLLDLKKSVRKIKRDNFFYLVEEAFNLTPINDENLFKAVYFDKNSISNKFDKPSITIIFVFGFVGFGIALFILFVSNAIRKSR